MDPVAIAAHTVCGDKPTPVRQDSARASPDPVDEFQDLVDDINAILGPSSGIDSADVDVDELKKAMAGYTSNEGEWSKYAFADASRPYTRNLVDRGNGKANLLILVWTPGKASPIHDHANAHCVMKILKGSLTETIYAWPCQSQHNTKGARATTVGSVCPNTRHTCSASSDIMGPTELQVTKQTTYIAEEVAYMSDTIGLHRVSNPSQDEFAVSLHLYTPPNAAKHGCHIFDPKTGRKSHVDQCHFFSELGVLK